VKTALIIGAGPAGLTSALELLEKGGIHPIVVEQENFVGGISRTVEHNGNRMDIGGHRFFSKNNWVISRILYMRKFFDYPVSLNANTIKGLGLHVLSSMPIKDLINAMEDVPKICNLERE